MNEKIIEILNISSYISSVLIIFLGCLVFISMLLYPIYFLLNNVLYKRTKASFYFISYMRYRKEFAEWKKENKPNVYTPKINK